MRRLGGLALALALTGCAAFRPALTCAERGGPPWIELQAPHFVVDTDLPEPEARAAVAEYERIERAFEDLSPGAPAPGRTLVVLFAREDDYRALAPPETGGYFVRSRGADVIYVPTIVLYGALDRGQRQKFQHELNHRHVRRELADPPTWLAEGLADYYSTMAFAHGGLAIGLPARRPLVDPPPLAQLMSTDRDAFYADAKRYYYAAWALVHMLKNGHRTYPNRFAGYLKALAAGRRAAEAWQATFGDIPFGELQRDYDAHVRATTATVWTVPYFVPEPPAPTVRALPDAKVHLLWARLRSWKGDHAAVRAEVDEARRLAPRDPAPLFWAARLAMADGKLDEAEQRLADGLRLAPGEERLSLARFELHRVRAVVSHARFAELEPEVRALLALARAPETLNAVAWYWAERERADEGLPAARRAVEADPTCARCLDTLALLLFHHGEVDRAIWLEERALGMLPETIADRGMSERLRRYRQAAKQPAPPPPPPTSVDDLPLD